MFRFALLRYILRAARRRKQRTVLWLVLVITGIVLVVWNLRDLGYITRPIWDKKPRPWNIVKRYHHPDVPSRDLCGLYGWTVRNDTPADQASSKTRFKVWDATMFSFEVDLLEIRLHELWDLVDHFIIIESDRTFSGQTKPLVFCSLRHTDKFQWAASKIIYETVNLESIGTSKLSPAETAWHNEGTMRIRMNSILTRFGVQTGDLVIQSDVDEIPARSTITLLRRCDKFPDTLHLSLHSFIYSFEFTLPHPTTRASVKTFRAGDDWYYSHQRHSDELLEDAGWHCSFCFRYLSDFRAKMVGFSHFDRVTKPGSQLRDEEIQRKICDGLDIFDMFPEVYSFRDLWDEFFRPYRKTTSFIHMPMWLLRNPGKFAFLLPGGCQRDAFVNITSNSTCY